jgi:hypothetical protein
MIQIDTFISWGVVVVDEESMMDSKPGFVP